MNSFGVVCASYVNSEQDNLPDFLQRLAEYLSRGNASELARYKREIAQQEKIKQDRIKATRGAILRPSLAGSSVMSWDYYVWPDVLLGVSPDQYTPWGVMIAHVDNALCIRGSAPDGYLAYLEAIGSYGSVSGEALTRFSTNEEVSNIPVPFYADFMVYAKKGPLTGSGPPPPVAVWKNYVIIQYAYNPSSMWDWHYVGYAQVFADGITEYYIGTTFWNDFNQISVSTISMANWYITEKSSVYVDNARVYLDVMV